MEVQLQKQQLQQPGPAAGTNHSINVIRVGYQGGSLPTGTAVSTHCCAGSNTTAAPEIEGAIFISIVEGWTC